MKVIIATPTTTNANMVRGAFQQMKVQNTEIVAVQSADELSGAVEEGCMVLVDWEFDAEVGGQMVTAAKKAKEETPVLLLCTKQKSGTTFAGMKAGAAGIVNKPLDPDDLVRTVAAALRNAKGAKKQSVNVEFINPFIDATRNVFSTMCGIDTKRKKLFLKEDHKMVGEVSGVMGLTGSATGSVVISMPGKLACMLVGRMLGEQPAEELNNDVCDGVGEIINMIAGQAKAMLVKTRYHFKISIPSVVKGLGHEISHKKGTPNIVVLFESEGGQEFALQVCLSPTEMDEE